MSVEISYKRTTLKQYQANLVLFTNEKFSTTNLKKYLLKSELSYINDLLNTSDFKKNLFVFEIGSKKKDNINFNKEKLKKFRCRKSRS